MEAFEHGHVVLSGNDSSHINKFRNEAFDNFKKLGFPDSKTEDWKNTDLKNSLSRDYSHFLEKGEENVDLEKIFTCDIHNFETDQISLLNGWHVQTDVPVTKFDNGVIVGSLSEAFEEHTLLIDQHLGKIADHDKNIFHALNAAFSRDGVFIYIPDNVVIEKPIQMIGIINHPENLFLQTRNLIILGKNSKLTLVHCDDSTNHQASFNNSVTEVFLGENSTLDHYKLQNLNDESTLLNSSFFHQEANSNLTTNAISLNGGLIRNYTNVRLAGEGANTNVLGLYLMDKQQHIDNQVYINHEKPNCYSNELFKGIIDDKASSVFNGHIYVARDAQQTNAFQNNNNILLTDEAKANAKPFLEIYADDVKCSHGATIGQLDMESLFYIRSRGICQASARLLLMYAFAAEVINHIHIDALKTRIDDMVKRRLRGELSICDTCVLHCNNPEKEIHFDIDLSKI